MPPTTLDKGKGRALPEDEETILIEEENASSSSSSSEASNTSSESEGEDEITQDVLDSLLEKARQSARASASGVVTFEGEEDVIQLGKDETEEPLPSLDPGTLPTPYIELGTSKTKGKRTTELAKARDLDAEQVEQASNSTTPSSSAPPPSALPKGKELTKREKKATAGKSWFDLPAPAEADLPKLYREVEALRLRNQLDPKRFYRKDPGEGKGIKGLPKYFAIGTIVSEPSPFGASNPENLNKSQRKRTLVDELVDDAEAKSYAKKKFKELQSVRGAKGRGTLAQRQAKRKPKW
ncbi:Fcf2 pre-rRNA processing-domain-containing protein [Irpex rosettiformis]|uniref:Fcf2 pre-rRNA processing-domain-containing protein n=1 Tax=Irpex rosettiformis TaxID=378272 RepID=A0ACB8TS05_9APHY|nr:Fcf2 pre-rRNA processing-domain-containing protein [Irpex rosettiformis]